MTSSLSRRTLLRSGALLTAAGSLPGLAVAAPEAAAGRAIRLGIATYTFRSFPRAQMIGWLKQLGIASINAKDVKDHLPSEPAEEARAVADYAAAGIELHAGGAIYFTKDEDDDIRAKFEYAKRAGLPVIVAGDPAPTALKRIERFVKEYGIRIAIHNHGPEDKLWPSPLDVLKDLKGMDPRMGVCIDVGHAVRAGANVVAAIHAAGPRLHNVHMKDLTSFTDRESQVAVGRGKMPIRGIFEALARIGYKGWVDLEYEIHGDDPMPGVTESLAYMRGVLAGMGYAAAS
ncbi:MAG: sugar phosphate isomerase/epimerase [Terracidiphilus sp.]